ncbi:MAG: CPBP family intramembrane metalloprotease [Parasporobacterium sp.]|nr:CPBP family intramembrane metalloprotease [Parasporobacterium sp.]
MNADSLLYKIWRIAYAPALYLLLDILIVWAVQSLLVSYGNLLPGSFLAVNLAAISSMVFLAVSILVLWNLYRKDMTILHDRWILSRPWCFALLALIGVLASHGLSILVSLLGIDRLAGDYSGIQDAVFAASPVLVVIQTVILAPLSEELLFRGLLYSRLRQYLKGFWLPALISSAAFGIFHFNLSQGIFAFLFGLLLCAVYEKFRNLWAPIALHVGGNLISVVLVFLGFDYPAVWTGVLVMAVTLAAAGFLYEVLVRRLHF